MSYLAKWGRNSSMGLRFNNGSCSAFIKSSPLVEMEAYDCSGGACQASPAPGQTKCEHIAANTLFRTEKTGESQCDAYCDDAYEWEQSGIGHCELLLGLTEDRQIEYQIHTYNSITIKLPILYVHGYCFLHAQATLALMHVCGYTMNVPVLPHPFNPQVLVLVVSLCQTRDPSRHLLSQLRT